MSAARNPESVASQPQQFHSRVPPSEPLTERGHKPGVIASERDAAPEFSAQTLPAGTAPADRTFKPNPVDEVPTTNVDLTDDYDPEAERAGASDTLGGATTADVHKGLGHPGQGMVSSELRHDGVKKREKQGYGKVAAGAEDTNDRLLDSRQPEFADQRRLDEEDMNGHAGTRGKQHPDYPTAEDKPKVTSEELASELPQRTTARGREAK